MIENEYELNKELEFINNIHAIYKKLSPRITRKYNNFSQYYHILGYNLQINFKIRVLVLCFKFKIFGAKEIANFTNTIQPRVESVLNDFKEMGIIKLVLDTAKVDRIYNQWKNLYPTSPFKPNFYEVNDLFLSKISDYIDYRADLFLYDDDYVKIELRNKHLSSIHNLIDREIEYFADCVFCGKGITKLDYDNDEFVTYQDKNYHKLCWKTYTTERYM